MPELRSLLRSLVILLVTLVAVTAADPAQARPEPKEWWHYTLDAEPFPTTYFDFPVARRSLTS